MRIVAIIGDVVVLTVLTVVGFAMHETLGAAARLSVTVGAFLVAWLWIAVSPIFVVVMTAVTGVGLVIWRGVLAWWLTSRSTPAV